MIKQVYYSTMKIAWLRTIFYVLLFLSIHPALSCAVMISPVTCQDTTKMDTVAKKIPERIVTEDSTFGQYQKSPWQMSKLAMNQYFSEDLGGLLNYFAGIYMLNLGSAGQRLAWGRHGTDNRQTSLFFDGRPFYDPIDGGIDLNFIPVGFTKSLTVEQGLSSSLVTSNAEMISLKSDDYEEDTPYSQVSYHKAPYGFSDVDIIFGQKISSKMNLLLGGIIKSYDGKTISYSFEQQNFRGKVDYQLTPIWQFEYSWINNKIKRHIPDPALIDDSYQATDASQKVSRWDQTLKIKGRIFQSDFQNFQANLFYSSASDKLKDKNFNFQFTDASHYAGFNFQIQQRWLGQRITSGANVIHEWTDADQVGKKGQTFGSIFIQDDWDWKDRFGIRILGNYQFHNRHGFELSGGLSSFYFLSKNARITASARQSLRNPTFFELYARTNFVGNSELKPETHQKIEISAEWKIEPKFSLTSSLYYKTIEYAIQLYPMYSLRTKFLNQNKIKYPGFDIEARWAFLSKFYYYALVSTIDNSSPIDQPAIILTNYLQYSDSFFQNDIRPTIRFESRYFSASYSTIYHPYRHQAYRNKLGPVIILNAHAILDFGNLKVFITLENILDEKYQLIYGYPMNERTLHYGLRWEFWN